MTEQTIPVQIAKLEGRVNLNDADRVHIWKKISELADSNKETQASVMALAKTMDRFLLETKWLHRAVGFLVVSIGGGTIAYYVPKILDAIGKIITQL